MGNRYSSYYDPYWNPYDYDPYGYDYNYLVRTYIVVG